MRTPTDLRLFVLACFFTLHITAVADPKLSSDDRLSASQPATKNQDWQNSLSMKFKPVGDVLFSVWETRVSDFEQFVKETGHDATKNVYSFAKDGRTGFELRGHSWKNPGFPQFRTHPVCGVSWNDSVAFCKWLTERERERGMLKESEHYRLPTDSEWSMAAGSSIYPWGDKWNSSNRALANYAGIEAKDADWAGAWFTFTNKNDAFSRTAPVGSFAPNQFGLYDMGGNVWEWCEDWFRKEMNTPQARESLSTMNDDMGGNTFKVIRGASWIDAHSVKIASNARYRWKPTERTTTVGFRCILSFAK